jgi:hypothetical protein
VAEVRGACMVIVLQGMELLSAISITDVTQMISLVFHFTDHAHIYVLYVTPRITPDSFDTGLGQLQMLTDNPATHTSFLRTQLSQFHTSLGHTLHTPKPPRKELHDRHHLVAVAGHAVARLAVPLDLQELEQTLELVFRRRSHSRAI